MSASVPDEGPSQGVAAEQAEPGGDSSDDGSPAEDERRLEGPLILRYSIRTTADVVRAFNTTRNVPDRETLVDWLSRYANCYSQERRSLYGAGRALELAHVARMKPVSESAKRTVCKTLDALVDALPTDGTSSEASARGLCRAVEGVDPEVFGSDVTFLIEFAHKLFERAQALPRMTDYNFQTHEPLFRALQKTMTLVHKVGQMRPTFEDKRGLYLALLRTYSAVCYGKKCYLVVYHFKRLEQAIERVSVENPPSPVWYWVRFAELLLYAAVAVPRNVLCCEYEPTKKFFQSLEKLNAGFGIPKAKWFDKVQQLQDARIKAMLDADKWPAFEAEYTNAVELYERELQRENAKWFTLGVIGEVKVLATEGHARDVRVKAIGKLVDFAKVIGTRPGWNRDSQCVDALCQALHDAYVGGEDRASASTALKQLHESRCPTVAKGVKTWLRLSKMDDKLVAVTPPTREPEIRDLFYKTGREFGVVPLEDVRVNIRDLRHRYDSPPFSSMKTLYGDGRYRHVSPLDYELFVTREDLPAASEGEDEEGGGPDPAAEANAAQRSPISAKDLFRPRTGPDGRTREIRKVLLVGGPGVGKSGLTKMIAQQWATGKMFRELGAVYVVALGEMRSMRYDDLHPRFRTGLVTAVANTNYCGKHDDKYELTKIQIATDLQSPTTLLIFDEVEDRDEAGEAILLESGNCACKVLTASRRTRASKLCSLADIEVECTGVPFAQARQIAFGELPPEKALRLFEHLAFYPVLLELVRIPIVLYLLCPLWNNYAEGDKGDADIPSFVRFFFDMTLFLWGRRSKNRGERSSENRSDVFERVAAVAADAIGEGTELLPEPMVAKRGDLYEADRLADDAGYLLSRVRGSKFKFLHVTFQDYFASRRIQRFLLEDNDHREEHARKLVNKYKYSERMTSTFFFLAGNAERQRENEEIGFDRLFEIVNGGAMEIMGLQDVFLRVRILNAYFANGRPSVVDALGNRAEALRVVRLLKRLLSKCDPGTLLWDVLIENLKRAPKVLQKFTGILDDRIDRWTMREWMLVDDRQIVDVVRRAPSVFGYVRDRVASLEEDEDWTVRELSKKTLEAIERVSPRALYGSLDAESAGAPPEVPAAEEVAGEDVNLSASDVVSRLQLLLDRTKDRDAAVRSKAAAAVRRISFSAVARCYVDRDGPAVVERLFATKLMERALVPDYENDRLLVADRLPLEAVSMDGLPFDVAGHLISASRYALEGDYPGISEVLLDARSVERREA